MKRAKRAGVFLDPDLRCGYEPVTPDDDNWILVPTKTKTIFTKPYHKLPFMALTRDWSKNLILAPLKC